MTENVMGEGGNVHKEEREKGNRSQTQSWCLASTGMFDMHACAFVSMLNFAPHAYLIIYTAQRGTPQTCDIFHVERWEM